MFKVCKLECKFNAFISKFQEILVKNRLWTIDFNNKSSVVEIRKPVGGGTLTGFLKKVLFSVREYHFSSGNRIFLSCLDAPSTHFSGMKCQLSVTFGEIVPLS